MYVRFLALLLLLPLLANAQQMYRWVDDDGNMHYSDRVPASAARKLEKLSISNAAGSAPLPYALQQAVKNFPVALYTSESCKDTCVQAREFLNNRGVPYSEHAVADEEDIAAIKRLTGGTVVPVMTVGHEVYKGFESGIYKTALDTAGYPASSLLPRGVEARKLVVKPAKKPAPAAGTEGSPATAATETSNTSAQK
ncbi:MAG: glutaredoxin family protein [Burkholderiales bacterium]|nr:glutaredoxin family protein [Burkholderiales bacterium]